MKAHQILEAGLGHMKDRSATYDKPAGERSMGATVDAFRAITGHDLTEEQGWLFMGLLKMVRSQQGGFRADNYEDLAAYAGLQGEAAWAERTNQDFGQQNTIDCRSAEQKGEAISVHVHHDQDVRLSDALDARALILAAKAFRP